MKTKIFHIDNPKYNHISKHDDGTYRDIKFAWGHVLTNKANRKDSEFAIIVCPNGTRINKINHATFKHMFCGNEYDHVKFDPDHVEKLDKDLSILPYEFQMQIFERFLKRERICVAEFLNFPPEYCPYKQEKSLIDNCMCEPRQHITIPKRTCIKNLKCACHYNYS